MPGRGWAGSHGPGGEEIAVGLLGGGDLGDDLVQVPVERRIGMDHQGIGGALDGLVDVGVVVALALVGPLDQAAGDGEVVDRGRSPRIFLKRNGIVTVRFVSMRGSQKASVTWTWVNGTGRMG